MIDELKPYPAMKVSGVPWLGEVPEHWGIARSKRLFSQRKEFARPEDEQLSATQAYGVIPQAIYESRTGYRVVKISLHLEKRRHVEADDFVISMRSFEGGLERAWSPGAIRSSYVVLKPSKEVQPSFFQYLFKSSPYIAALRGTADFIRDGQDLNFDNFCDVSLPLIPVQEQAAIVRFLDHADRKIRRYIRAKQKLIKLLEEQKQAIIHHAVTRGLDPNVRLKASGVEWLGDVPEHWEVVLNQRILKEEIRAHRGEAESQLSLSQRSGLIPTNEMQERSLQTSSFANWKVTVPGDLVVNRFKAHLGVFFASTIRGIVSFHYGVFAPRRPLIAKYYELLYHTNVYRCIYAGQSNGMTIGLQNLSNQNFYNVRTIVPPVGEQKSIVAFSEEATEHLQKAIKSAYLEIELLREYLTRLVADIVTGKLDVREAAAQLPDEDHELPTIDELDVICDAEEDGFDDLDEGTEDPEP